MKTLIELKNLAQSIDELKQSFTPTPESSNIKLIAHVGNTMYVMFKSEMLYAYDMVSKEFYEQFKASESKGKFFSQNVSKKIPGTKYTTNLMIALMQDLYNDTFIEIREEPTELVAQEANTDNQFDALKELPDDCFAL